MNNPRLELAVADQGRRCRWCDAVSQVGHLDTAGHMFCGEPQNSQCRWLYFKHLAEHRSSDPTIRIYRIEEVGVAGYVVTGANEESGKYNDPAQAVNKAFNAARAAKRSGLDAQVWIGVGGDASCVFPPVF